MRETDHRRVWQTINWKRNLQTCDKSLVTPSDEEFKEYFENDINPDHVNVTEIWLIDTAVNIPLLDDPITPQELMAQVARYPNRSVQIALSRLDSLYYYLI